MSEKRNKYRGLFRFFYFDSQDLKDFLDFNEEKDFL
jgi:hypothetical protein